MQKKLIDLFETKTARIAIVGLGYVGLPLALRFVEVGFPVIGLDVDSNKIERLRQGKSYIKHISSARVEDAVEADRFEATTDFSRAAEADALIICVPTPLNRYREPDLSYVTGTVDSLVPHLRGGQVLSLESTTYPGTTEEELLPRIESRGLVVGKDFFLIYSPEREDPANPYFSTASIPKVCGGMTKECLGAGVALYSQIIDKVVPVSSTKTAEMTKLLENIYRAVNIGLVNELKIVADRMDIDIWEVINAAATKPFGFTPFYPGPGLGGHCIPIDPFYLTWKAREFGIHTRFIELAGEINTSMPEWVIAKISDALNVKGKALHGAKVLVLGIAYKKNVDDMRESPSVALMEILRDKGTEVFYSDPYVPIFPKMREHRFDLSSTALTKDFLASVDCAVLATDHDDFDYPFILEHAPLIVDTRGVYPQGADKVVKA